MRTLLTILALMFAVLPQATALEHDPTPTLARGKMVYATNCVLCHGDKGDGDGRLPSMLADYPDTNLIDHQPNLDADGVRNAIIWGSSANETNVFSPPWGNELTWSEIESVTQYVLLLVQDPVKASAVSDVAPKDESLSLRVAGRELYLQRCVLCHGERGDGKGRLSKAIKNPPPANFRISRFPREYYREIILKGGAAVRRSEQMPPWVDELSIEQIESLVTYTYSLRFGLQEAASEKPKAGTKP